MFSHRSAVRQHVLDSRSVGLIRIGGLAVAALDLRGFAVAVQKDNADVGMGIYSCAKALDLDFIEVGFEEYDFVTYEKYLELPAVREFIHVLKGEAFKERLDMLGGYSCEECGQIIRG